MKQGQLAGENMAGGEKLYIRNTAGEMVPFTSLALGRWTSGSPKLDRRIKHRLALVEPGIDVGTHVAHHGLQCRQA